MSINNLSEFIQGAIAERQRDGSFIVYADGVNRVGKIVGCEGNNEFEAKEYAYNYVCYIRDEINKAK